MHRLRKLFTRLFGTVGAGRCMGCNRKLTVNERTYYECECERCVADSMRHSEGS